MYPAVNITNLLPHISYLLATLATLAPLVTMVLCPPSDTRHRDMGNISHNKLGKCVLCIYISLCSVKCEQQIKLRIRNFVLVTAASLQLF